MLSPIDDVEAYVATRTAWHAVAERVLAPALHAATGRIGLRVGEAGITTPPFGPEPTTVAIRPGNLTVRRGEHARVTSLSTLGAAAAFVGVPVPADTGVYTATTPTAPETNVAGDPRLATALAAWFAFGEDVLRTWRAHHPDETPAPTQLWPEHFDLATDLGPDDARRASFGASPGDGDHQLPYLYVGPWHAGDDAFWDAGTYARLGHQRLAGLEDPVAAALDFFRRGHEAATANS
jgi:hypothetical protein